MNVNYSNVKQRNQVADVEKFLAAVLVVSGHLIAHDKNQLPSPYYFFNILAVAHMPLFCIISGWFSGTLMGMPFTRMLKKAEIRLLLPYLVWSSVAVFAKMGRSLLDRSFSLSNSVHLWIKTVLFGTSVWFFLALFLIWILGWGVFRVESKSGWLAILAVFAIMIIPIPYESDIYALSRLHDLFPIFYLGFYINRKRTVLLRLFRKNSVISFFIFSCVCIITLLLIPKVSTICLGWFDCHILTPFRIVIEISVLSAVFMPAGWIIHKGRNLEACLAKMGYFSMDIYCIHMMFVEYLSFQMPDSIISANQIYSSLAYFVEAIIITVFCVAIAWILRQYVKPYRCLMTGKW